MIIAAMILGGFVALIAGGEFLVRGASSIALAAKVSPLVIGLTVVALGTSAPEMGVSIQSCYSGATALAIGNAVGSNISNILLVLGASAIAMPLAVHSRLFRLDIPVMLAAAVALWGFGADGGLSRVEGILLVVAMIGYFVWTVTAGRKETKQLEAQMAAELGDLPDNPPSGPAGIAIAVAQVVGGLVLLVGGAKFLVDGCVELATYFGVNQMVVGLTVTAIGTSLPELVTSFMAALRGNRDLAVGNVVGSNILNVLAVLGVSAVVAPSGIPVDADAISFHIPVMVAVSVVCLPVFLTGAVIMRSEGIAMLAYYGAYMSFIAYTAKDTTEAIPVTTTLLFTLPLAVLTVYSLAMNRRVEVD